ncbi:hypothetical protein AVEN_53046-1, partial [Araneus ventricosus]
DSRYLGHRRAGEVVSWAGGQVLVGWESVNELPSSLQTFQDTGTGLLVWGWLFLRMAFYSSRKASEAVGHMFPN